MSIKASGANSSDTRSRAPVDETRPGPTGPIQPVPKRMPDGEPSAAGAERADTRGPGQMPGTAPGGSNVMRRSERLRQLREQIRSGTYEPPRDDVAEVLAAFFVTDRPYLPTRRNDP